MNGAVYCGVLTIKLKIRSFCLVADVKRAYRSWTTPSPFALCRQSAFVSFSCRYKKMKITIKQIKLITKKKKPLIQVACVKNYRENYILENFVLIGYFT